VAFLTYGAACVVIALPFVRSFLVTVVLVLATMGAAAAAPAGDARDLDEAKQLRDRGVEALHGGRRAEALEWFRKSYARYPSARMRYNLAVVLDQLGQSAEAVENYEDFLAAATADEPAQVYARQRIAALEPTIARLKIDVSPRSARVSLDQHLVTAVSPAGAAVAPGTVQVEAEEAGYATITVTVPLVAGERRRLELKLTRIDERAASPPPAPAVPPPAAPPPATATAAPPSSRAAPLARRAAPPPPRLAPPPPAPHALVLAGERGDQARRPLVRRPWFWATLAGGAAIVAAGVTVGVLYGRQSHYPSPSIPPFPGD
jgi:hypothetical protein